MLTLLFVVLLLTIFGKLLIFAIKAAWGITKILLNIVLLPLIIIGMFAGGLTYLALIVLAIVGLVSLIKGHN
jgi:hypothetical protein